MHDNTAVCEQGDRHKVTFSRKGGQVHQLSPLFDRATDHEGFVRISMMVAVVTNDGETCSPYLPTICYSRIIRPLSRTLLAAAGAFSRRFQMEDRCQLLCRSTTSTSSPFVSLSSALV